MNPDMRKTLLAASVAALFASSAAFAGDEGRGHGRDPNQHSASVELSKKVSLESDVELHGDPRVGGRINVDSAALAIIDNQQSVTRNAAANDKLTNSASIGDNVGSGAAGNLGFNVAAGDNNTQDNAAALSATDASFAFGLADAEVFVNQTGSGNAVLNQGVTNTATLGGNAFSNASGNLGVNIASGNNNEQKNALAASTATTSMAQATISSNQVSTGNVVSNAGRVERYDDTTQVSLSGPVRGYSVGVGIGGYEGDSRGSYSGGGSLATRGNAYQQSNFYPDNWSGNTHPSGSQVGHSDFDNETQGAVQNPYRNGVGGLAFDTDSRGSLSESGQTRSHEEGDLGFVEFSASDLYANLTGTVTTSRYVVVNATNTANLSGSAFRDASGNIGVNVASGTGNLQANSLALAVAQPGAGGGGER